jgi:plasmid replication initiation protein
MALLPDRYPQHDLFTLDLADVAPKDDRSSMAVPMFALRPENRQIHCETPSGKLIISPSYYGLPSIHDKDVLIFAISQLMARKNRGLSIGPRVRFSARELLMSVNRPTNDIGYDRLGKCFQRLTGTTFETDIQTGGRVESRVFSLIAEGGFVRNAGSNRVHHCELILSDWVMRAVEASEVLSISPTYFRLRRPLERRLYEIARKHLGSQTSWQIRLCRLQEKTGSRAPLKRFRHNVRQIIKENDTPDFRFELRPDDIVIVRPRSNSFHVHKRIDDTITIPAWAEDQARQIAIDKGWAYDALLQDWMDFAKAQSAKGNPPKNPGASFIGFVKKIESLR